MTRRNLILSSAALAGALIAPSAKAAFSEGTKLPDLSTFGLSGNLPKTEGNVIYLDFWASWCAPCKASFPILNRWHEQMNIHGFSVIGISVDESEEDMNRFLQKNKVSFPVTRDAAHKLVSTANVSTMPTAFIIDRKGIIRHVHSGFHKRDEPVLFAQINQLMAQR